MKMKAGGFIPELVRHFFKKPITLRYSIDRLNPPLGFRGTPVLTPEKCIVCKACVRDCPADAIEINTLSAEEKKYQMIIHNDRCVHCGQCADSCPTNAIALNREFELAEPKRRNFKIEYVYTRQPKKTA